MVLFALSCVGLLLFLWLSFGGTIPLGAQGYRINVSFPNAQDLATQADVRIAGVSVGKVVSTQLAPQGNRTEATIQLGSQYAPIRRDTRAILRTKTILGETYVQLIPGSPNGPPIPDGGTLPDSQVLPTTQLSDIFNAFDPTTRRAFQVWQQQLAKAINGNDQNLNDVLGNLPTFAADATDILQVLDVQHLATVSLLQNGGTVFGALGSDQTALRNLITSSETTFATTAANNNKLAQIFQVFPTFLNETKRTMAKLQTFSGNTDPLVRELANHVAPQMKPTLHDVQLLAPPLRHFFTNLGPLITVSQTGLPAVSEILTGAAPTLGALGSFLEQLNPILGWLSEHQQLTSDFISNGASPIAATTTSFSGGVGHYLRQFGPVGPETLSFAPNRDPNNRGNTYPNPLWGADSGNFSSNIPASWDCNNTGAPGNGTEPASGSGPGSTMACRVAPPQPGAPGPAKNPFIAPANYPNH